MNHLFLYLDEELKDKILSDIKSLTYKSFLEVYPDNLIEKNDKCENASEAVLPGHFCGEKVCIPRPLGGERNDAVLVDFVGRSLLECPEATARHLGIIHDYFIRLHPGTGLRRS